MLMIVCVDVGGTKTLLGWTKREVDRPQFTDVKRIKTPETYEEFLGAIQRYVNELHTAAEAISVAYPGRVDPETKHVIKAQNLNWGDASLERDLKERLPDVKRILVENDGNLGGLAEATSGAGAPYKSMYYLTISTGIGGGYITNGTINSSIGNSEPGHMVVAHETEVKTWEEWASGKAFFDRYGKTAAEADVQDEAWGPYTQLLFAGFVNIIALCNPDAIIVGGGVGSHFDTWWPHLHRQLKEHLPDFLELPDIKAAQHAEQAVLEGAFYYAR